MIWILVIVILALLIYLQRLRSVEADNRRIQEALFESLAAAASQSGHEEQVARNWIANLEDLTLPGDFDKTFSRICSVHGVSFQKATNNSTFRLELAKETRSQLVEALCETLRREKSGVYKKRSDHILPF